MLNVVGSDDSVWLCGEVQLTARMVNLATSHRVGYTGESSTAQEKKSSVIH